ncbi:MAG: hypothetical protein U0670_03515 [Anaerolineae bacterium]
MTSRSWMRLQQFLIVGHTLAYGFVWFFTLLGAIIGDYSSIPNWWVVMLLVWSAAYMLHGMSFMAARGRVGSTGDDRQAYRDGYQDAMRNILAMQERDHVERRYDRRLMIDDEGELLELMEEGKRKRS